MTKRQLIDEIITINRTAQPGFLARFEESDLDEYLRHLLHARTNRLSGDSSRFQKYFRSQGRAEGPKKPRTVPTLPAEPTVRPTPVVQSPTTQSPTPQEPAPIAAAPAPTSAPAEVTAVAASPADPTPAPEHDEAPAPVPAVWDETGQADYDDAGDVQETAVDCDSELPVDSQDGTAQPAENADSQEPVMAGAAKDAAQPPSSSARKDDRKWLF
ncbi:MAG: hypothetical protein ACE15C_09850 [Phycisphaerae bacterium]